VSETQDKQASKPSRRKRGERMSEQDLLNLIARLEQASLGSSVSQGANLATTVYPTSTAMTTLELDRWNALNYYYGRPLGNEIENRSQVVLPELRDTVEWIIPQLMRVFASSKHIVRFEPETAHDVEQAQLETAYVNHVLMQDNNGFFLLHDFFKDTLLLRASYVKVYWEDEDKTQVERYTGITEQELPLVLHENDQSSIEVLEQREHKIQVPEGGQPVSVFDLKVRRTTKGGRVCVECVPCEEIRVSPSVRGSLDEKSNFTQHKTNKTRSDLVVEGYDKDLVYAAQKGTPDWLNIDALARNEVTDQMQITDGDTPDLSMQEVEVRENIMRVDFDGDGIAELRRVVVIGDQIADNEEIEEHPIASGTAIRMPHRHLGMSLYDLLADLQLMKTTLFRQGFDNLAQANNGRLAIDWRTVNTDDLLTSRPGGVVRTSGPPSESIMNLQIQSNLVEQVIPAMEYLDQLREMRTGVGRDTMGLDMDVLQDVTKGGQLAGMAAAGLKVELMARMLAEGVKDICQRIHGALRRHQNQPVQFQLSGQWAQVNPSEWGKRSKITPVVGLGSGSRTEARANIMQLAAMQEKLAPLGLVGPQQAYETFKVGCDVLGYDSPERFAMDPKSPEYQQHMQQMQGQQQQAPQVQAAQIRAKTEQEKLSAQQQMEKMRLAGELKIEEERHSAELQHAAIQAQSDRAHQTRSNLLAADVATHSAVVSARTARDQQQNDLVQALIKAFSQILASQLKQNAQADAGQLMTRDVREAESGLRGT
jgi:hypothetical protein